MAGVVGVVRMEGRTMEGKLGDRRTIVEGVTVRTNSILMTIMVRGGGGGGVGQQDDDEDSINEDDNNYDIASRDIFGKYPLLVASDPNVVISLTDGFLSATEVQILTLLVDKPFIYKVQSVFISGRVPSFSLSFKQAGITNLMPCNFGSIAEAQEAVTSLEAELNSLPSGKVWVDNVVSGTGQESNPWKFRITFLEPVGPLPLLNSENAKIVQEVQGKSTLGGSVVLLTRENIPIIFNLMHLQMISRTSWRR
jgi:hypothetical protein